MQTVVIAGGTGLIGRQLSHLLRGAGFEVLHVSRKANLNAEFPTFAWNPMTGSFDATPFERADFIINLAGAGIADKPWTAARKREIIESRTQSAAIIERFLRSRKHHVKAYIAASAIGYYGNRAADEWLDENASAGSGFLTESTLEWEQATQKIAQLGIRTVAFRIGIVLSTQGGALEKMLISFRFLLGTYFGTGEAVCSWIHIEDMASMFLFAIQNNTLNGIYNANAPNPVTNYALTVAIRHALQRPALLIPVPAFALRLAMGELADVVLNGNRVSAKKIVSAGFQFKFPSINEALLDVVKRKI